MEMIKTIKIIIISLLLNGCAAYGYLDSDDFDVVVRQGFDMEKNGRFVPAEERYFKALSIAEKKCDNRDCFCQISFRTLLQKPFSIYKFF